MKLFKKLKDKRYRRKRLYKEAMDIALNTNLLEKIHSGKDFNFVEFLQNSYKYVKLVTLDEKVKINALKEKFNRCIFVSNKIDIEKEEWTIFRFKNGDAHYFFTNLKLIHPIERLPVFELKEIK